jgi:hypothetical protein
MQRLTQSDSRLVTTFLVLKQMVYYVQLKHAVLLHSNGACSNKKIHTYVHTYINTHTHTYIHMYIHTYVHTYIHKYTYVHTYIHTDRQT